MSINNQTKVCYMLLNDFFMSLLIVFRALQLTITYYD